MAVNPEEQLDAYALPEDEDGEHCERCGAGAVFQVGGTTLVGYEFFYCKDCICLLHSFPDLYFKVRFSPNLMLERGHPRLEAWLQPRAQVIQ